ncbi:unnamed protein product [Lampetra planeri]
MARDVQRACNAQRQQQQRQRRRRRRQSDGAVSHVPAPRCTPLPRAPDREANDDSWWQLRLSRSSERPFSAGNCGVLLRSGKKKIILRVGVVSWVPNRRSLRADRSGTAGCGAAA